MRHPASAAVLLLLLISLTTTVRGTVKTCEQGQVWARGRELINAMKGQLVLVAFPMASDTVTLQKLSSLAESHPSVRVIALLDAASCSVEQAAVMGRDWRWLVVDRDDIGSRQRLGLQQGEVALFDRCGRLSRTLPLSATEELNQSMRAAQHHASCGWCQYGTDGAAAGGGNTEGGKLDKKMDAFFQQALATQSPDQQRAYPRHHQPQSNQQTLHHQQNPMARPQPQQQQQQHRYPGPQQGGQPYNTQQQQQQNQQHQAAYEQQLRMPQQEFIRPPAPYRSTVGQRSASTVRQTPGHITHSQIRQHEYAQRGMTIPRPQTANAPPAPQRPTVTTDDYGDYDEVMRGGTPKSKEVDLRKPAFNEDAQWATASPFHQRTQHKDLFAVPPPTSFSYPTRDETNSRKPVKQATATTTEATNKAGAGFEDYADYEDYGMGAMKTFGSNDGKEEEDVEVSRSTQSRPRSVDQRAYDLENADEDEVPCKAITDDICYHQKKSGRKLSKCCKKGLYIADFCLPGKCSNTTVQACCMQKYLQAKYQCCENPDMEGTSATDAFSRCCHAHFVEEDDCCPPEAAAEYWQSVHDICLPNVQADLSTVKFEIRLSDGIRVLDLSETEKWQHECRYGGRRAQYVYVP